MLEGVGASDAGNEYKALLSSQIALNGGDSDAGKYLDKEATQQITFLRQEKSRFAWLRPFAIRPATILRALATQIWNINNKV